MFLYLRLFDRKGKPSVKSVSKGCFSLRNVFALYLHNKINIVFVKDLTPFFAQQFRIKNKVVHISVKITSM